MLSGLCCTINTKWVHYPILNHMGNIEVKWCCWPSPHQISCPDNGLRMTGEVIMTQGNRKSGWECIPSQNNLGVTLRLECGWLLAENTHQLEVTLVWHNDTLWRGRWCEEDSLQTAARSTPTETFFRLSLELVSHASLTRAVSGRHLSFTWTRQKPFPIMQQL